jgi:hypothetical protein
MGDGFEVLIWLAVMGFIGIRSAMQRSRAQSASRIEADPIDRPEPPISAPRKRRESPPRDRERREATLAPPARRGSGVLSRWTEFAAELERQMKEQQEVQRSRGSAFETEKTVVVPGRRVYPRSAAPTEPARRGEPSHWDDWQSEPDDHSLHDDDDPRGRKFHAPAPRDVRAARVSSRVETVERVRRPGLARLDGYDPLKRAVILADVLGTPPGLDGISPAERRLDKLR